MCSEKKRLANQRNAQKSTGPKTVAGKARSCRNGLKHGLAGMGSVLPAEDLEVFRERMQSWCKRERLKGDMESYLVATAVLASVRIDRCARNEFAVMVRKRREAMRNWQRRQDRKIARHEQNLATNPAEAKDRLQGFASGCGWLVEQWQDLAQALRDAGHWTDDQTQHALRLLGGPPEPSPDEPDEPDASAAVPAQAPAQAQAQVVRTNAPLLRPEAQAEPDAKQAALDALRAMMGDEMARLEREQRRLWFETEGPALAEAIDVATIDVSHEGALRHRYAVAAHLELHRSLGQLARRERLDRERAQKGELTEADAAAASASALAASAAGSGSSPHSQAQGDLNNELCDWLRQGGQKRTLPAGEAAAQAAPDSGPARAPTPSAEPQPAAPAPTPIPAGPPPSEPAAVRDEPTRSPSTACEPGTSGAVGGVAIAAPGLAAAVPPVPSTEAAAPQKESEPAASRAAAR